MCNVWKNPSVPGEEVSLKTLEKIPYGVDYLNLTGGEPTLRKDLMEIVELLYPRAATFEISSNGLHPERIEPIIKKYPCVRIRFSLEGHEETNNSIRGEKAGYARKINGLLRLKELGATDIGFGAVIQDENAAQLTGLFDLAREHNLEFATSILHNGFQFHKNDNTPYDRTYIAKNIEKLIEAQLSARNVKIWFRAYLNLGLIEKVLGHDRMLRCTAGKDFVFIDPWGEVFACNVDPNLKMGNLERQSWDEINNGSAANQVKEKVRQCRQNCWMVGSAKTAMRNGRFARIPKIRPALWVLRNRIRKLLGLNIPFDRYIDYSSVHQDAHIANRVSYLNSKAEMSPQRKSELHYQLPGGFFNK
jgi:MoaA/NifB/PqqE/SkfB family radical SAM enzyme